jgi:hypothetical protein
MENFARDWIDPTFHMSPLLFFIVFHVSTLSGLLAWIISYHVNTESFLGSHSTKVLLTHWQWWVSLRRSVAPLF